MAGIKKRLGSLLGPGGRVPQLVEGTTTNVSPSEPARVELTKTGEAEYRVDAQIPRGLDGDPNAVADFSETMAREIRTEGSAGREAISSVALPYGAGEGLNIWEGMAIWREYEDLIEDADTALLPDATKEQIGTASDGVTPIWAYTAGRNRAPHALLISGTHGHEPMPAAANFQWMKSFVGSHPAMRELRTKLRVTWVPWLNASKFRGTRPNSNEVDLNRNYGLNWTLHVPTSELHDKGDAPFSEPETSAIKTLIDNTDIGFFFDVHHHSSPQSDIALEGAPSWSSGDRLVADSARRKWAQEYGLGEYTTRYYPTPQPRPMGHPWAAKYIRWDLARLNAGGCLIETNFDLAGSSIWNMTDEAARLLCGAIHCVLTEWLRVGQTIGPGAWADIYAERTDTVAAQDTIPLQDGGRLIPDQRLRPVTFDSGRNYIGVPIVGPGRYTIHYHLNIRGAGTPGNVSAQAGIDIMPSSGDVSPSIRSRAYIYVEEGESRSLSGTGYIDVSTVPDDNILMAQVFAHISVASTDARVDRGSGLTAWVTYQPQVDRDYPDDGITRGA